MWYAPLERALGDGRAMWERKDKEETGQEEHALHAEEAELYPLFGGLTREEAVVIVQAAKCNVRANTLVHVFLAHSFSL